LPLLNIDTSASPSLAFFLPRPDELARPPSSSPRGRLPFLWQPKSPVGVCQAARSFSLSTCATLAIPLRLSSFSREKALWAALSPRHFKLIGNPSHPVFSKSNLIDFPLRRSPLRGSRAIPKPWPSLSVEALFVKWFLFPLLLEIALGVSFCPRPASEENPPPLSSVPGNFFLFFLHVSFRPDYGAPFFGLFPTWTPLPFPRYFFLDSMEMFEAIPAESYTRFPFVSFSLFRRVFGMERQYFFLVHLTCFSVFFFVFFFFFRFSSACVSFTHGDSPSPNHLPLECSDRFTLFSLSSSRDALTSWINRGASFFSFSPLWETSTFPPPLFVIQSDRATELFFPLPGTLSKKTFPLPFLFDLVFFQQLAPFPFLASTLSHVNHALPFLLVPPVVFPFCQIRRSTCSSLVIFASCTF